MKTVEKIQANCFYVLQGISCANTHFIENKRESDQFVHYVNRYLGEYLHVYEFSINSTGWTLVARTKSAITIKSTYQKKIDRSLKPPKVERVKVGDILSNAIRLMRSHFTRWTNSIRGREGNASKNCYKRFCFTSYEAAKTYIQRIRNQEIEMDQKNNRYRANAAYFDEDRQIRKNQNEMSSKIYQEKKVKKVMACLQIIDYINEKLSRWVKTTCKVYGVRYEGMTGAQLE